MSTYNSREVNEDELTKAALSEIGNTNSGNISRLETDILVILGVVDGVGGITSREATDSGEDTGLNSDTSSRSNNTGEHLGNVFDYVHKSPF